MTIQHCPVEVLDRIFEWVAFLSPRNAPAALSSVMMVCSHFQTVAKRHLLRIICLPTAEKTVAFVSFLKEAVNSGEYATSFLPIEHLALIGKLRIMRGSMFKSRTEAEAEAEHSAPFIISTAAPSLRSLTLFGIDAEHTSEIVNDQRVYCTLCVPDSIKFPLLCDLVALEQRVLTFSLLNENERAYQSRYPNLRRLYVLGYHTEGNLLPSALPSLDCLRLEIFDSTYVITPPRERIGHILSLIIDAPRYSEVLYNGYTDVAQSRAEYNAMVLEYERLAKEVGGLDGCRVVIPPDDHTSYVDRDRVLLCWMDVVGGGAGCWNMDWRPTVPYNGDYSNYD